MKQRIIFIIITLLAYGLGFQTALVQQDIFLEKYKQTTLEINQEQTLTCNLASTKLTDCMQKLGYYKLPEGKMCVFVDEIDLNLTME